VSCGLLLISVATNIYLIAISRLILGITVGWLWGLPTVLIIEITPARIRGRVAALMEMFFISGIVYMAGCCQFAFTSYDVGDWRTIAMVNSFVGLVAFILVAV